jgi:hypothetical protein
MDAIGRRRTVDLAEGEELDSNLLSQDFALFPFSTQRRLPLLENLKAK